MEALFLDKSKTPIFDSLAADLRENDPSFRDEILCPLCLQRFGRERIGELTKEHVVPKSLGGSVVTLTCKPCNSEFGHKVQSHLATLIGINDTFRGKVRTRGKLTVFEQSLPVDVKFDGGIHFDVLGGNAKAFEAIGTAAAARRSTKWSLSSQWKYSPWKGSTAIVRTAYLVAFHQFGYSYLLSAPLRAIREEIVAGMDAHSGRLCALTGTCKIPVDFVPSGHEPQALTVWFATEDDHKALFVLMRLRKHSDYFMFCVLPTEEQSVETMFADLHKVVDRLGQCSLQMEGNDEEITVRFVPKSQ